MYFSQCRIYVLTGLLSGGEEPVWVQVLWGRVFCGVVVGNEWGGGVVVVFFRCCSQHHRPTPQENITTSKKKKTPPPHSLPLQQHHKTLYLIKPVPKPVLHLQTTTRLTIDTHTQKSTCCCSLYLQWWQKRRLLKDVSCNNVCRQEKEGRAVVLCVADDVLQRVWQRPIHHVPDAIGEARILKNKKMQVINGLIL